MNSMIPARFSALLPRLGHLCLWLLVLAPVIYVGMLMKARTVDVGCWDEWEKGPLMQKWQDGTLGWKDLYAAQIQHRIVVPRLIIIGTTLLSGGDFRADQWLTFLSFVLDAWLLWLLLKRTLGDSPWRWPLMFVFNLMLFSPMHYQMLFWGSSLWSALPTPCLLALLLVLGTGRWPLWVRFVVSLLLAEIATHSFGHGLGIWPLVFVYFLIDPALGNFRQRAIAAGVWALIAAITIKCYFTDFINVAFHAYNLKPGDYALKGASSLFEGDHLQVAIRFFFAFIGAWFSRTPFVEHPLDAARMLGVWTIGAFALVAAAAVFYKPARENWRRTLPWLALAGYTIGVGLMVSKRGVDIGEHRAVTPRYLFISQYLLIASFPLVAIIGSVFMNSWRSIPGRTGGAALPLGACLLTAFAVLQLPIWQYGLHLTDVWYHARRQAKALVLFMPHIKSASMKPLVKSYDYGMQSINTLQSIGLLKTKPLESPELKWFKKDSKTLSQDKADITEAKFRTDGTLEIHGLARFGPDQPADAVLLTVGDRVIAIGQPAPRNLLRIYGLDYEFSNYEEVPARDSYRWQSTVPLNDLPDGDVTIDAWALDVERRSIASLNVHLTVQKAARIVQRAN